MAVAAGIAAFRFNLPMTVRSALYDVLGPYTWGWIGDLVDGFGKSLHRCMDLYLSTLILLLTHSWYLIVPFVL